mgnify:CR=1 FL=1
MFKFLELIQNEYDDLARLLSSEHGKTFPAAKGDIQRGLEVVEFACGIPHVMKGEYSEGAGPGIDLGSVADCRQEGRFGLLGMQQRAEQVGASLDLRRRPEGGTALSLEWRSGSLGWGTP